MKHVFIIGSKWIPAKYGGFETFVDKLVEGKQRENI
jgi:rhamnosyltransferase